jgi:hypothetical protein
MMRKLCATSLISLGINVKKKIRLCADMKLAIIAAGLRFEVMKNILF